MAIDTTKVTGRRILRFGAIGEALAEVDRLADAESKGRLRSVGNWTLGQAVGHLATWAELSYTGAPLKIPFFIRWFMRLRKKKFLYAPTPPGVKIPGVEGGTLGTDRMPTDVAVPRYRRAMGRLEREAPAVPDVLLGRLSQEEWIALNLRHAELHLGYFSAG